MTPVSATALDGACLRGKCEADAQLGYQLLKRVTTVMYRGVQGQVAFGADEVSDVIAVRPDLERGHQGRQRRGRHDPQRHGVQNSLAGRPLDRPQGFLGTVRPGHDGLCVHGWPPFARPRWRPGNRSSRPRER